MTEHELDTLLRDYGGAVRSVCRAILPGHPQDAEEAEAGFVTVVNGEAADYNKDGSWWCLTDAAGEMTSVGVADIELHDGDSYAFTYTK